MSAYPKFDDRAPCRKGRPDRFFPLKVTPEILDARQAECNVCPFKNPCLAWAIRHEKYGIWAGTTEEWRESVRAREGIPLTVPHVTLMLPGAA